MSDDFSHESKNTISTAKNLQLQTATANKSYAKRNDTTATTNEPHAQNKHKFREIDYLAGFDTQSNGDIHKQKWARTNRNNFHKAN